MQHKRSLTSSLESVVYGTRSEAVLEMVKRIDPGVPLIVEPVCPGGFTRSAE
jgi:hypothetical protein